ncbi:hypothetical protein Y1Q_0019398 [Alligator mississippiensis]|uniref:Uncharacterized protein n=1 Tax=Alligator mississippiensis TaxID=8496 RepID=A0A151MR63_ALLMI|nr:hypothetical protein Y1Q_0019398 [Alligator mississippiensis]
MPPSAHPALAPRYLRTDQICSKSYQFNPSKIVYFFAPFLPLPTCNLNVFPITTCFSWHAKEAATETQSNQHVLPADRRSKGTGGYFQAWRGAVRGGLWPVDKANARSFPSQPVASNGTEKWILQAEWSEAKLQGAPSQESLADSRLKIEVAGLLRVGLFFRHLKTICTAPVTSQEYSFCNLKLGRPKTEEWSNLPEITQQANGTVGNSIQVSGVLVQ